MCILAYSLRWTRRDVPQPIKISVPAFLRSHWSIFFSVLQIHDRLSEQFSDSLAAFGTTFLESQAALGKPKKLIEEG
jgi:hypothetical protein